MAPLYVLATTCMEPDLETSSILALARAIAGKRDGLDPGAELVLTPGSVSRGGLPGGACVVIRARGEGDEGRGAFIGYGLIPGPDARAATGLLMAAILDVTQPEAA